MNVKYKFQRFFSPNEKKALCITAFIVPFILMLGIFILQQIYPFGERSFLHVDMYHQYFPFLTEFYHKLKEGDSLLYSWNAGIGTNFLALYTYYLASPFNWLSVLMPESLLIEFQSYLVIIKIGLCGFTSCLYFINHFKTRSPALVFFSTFYALSGFMAAYNWNVMWLDVIFLTPLVILGLERLSRENKSLLYTLTLSLCILSNFYISIMLCIYLVFYFLLVILPESVNKLRLFIDFTIYSLLAGGLSGILLIPVLSALSLSEFTGSAFPTKADSYFPILDVLARHNMDVAVEIGLEHWPNIYAGVAVLFLFPLYVSCRFIPTKKKIGRLALLGFLLLSFCSNTLTFLWHGFNYPNSLPSRQSYLYIFLLLTVCLESFLHIKKISKTELSKVFFCVITFLILCQKLVTDDAFTNRTFFLSALFLSSYFVLIYFYRMRSINKKLLLFAFMTIFMLEAGLNTYFTSCPTVSRTSYLDNYDSFRSLSERNSKEHDFVRFERFNRVTNNDGMLYGYPSGSLFSSTINGLIPSFYEEYGMKSSKVFYSFDGATPFTSALLNLPYAFSKEDKGIPDDIEASSNDRIAIHKTDEKGSVSLYKSNTTLPFGYVIPAFDLNLTETVIEEEWEESLDEETPPPSEPSLYDLSEMFVEEEYAREVVVDDDYSKIRFKNIPLINQNNLARKLGATEDLFLPTKVTNTDSSSRVVIDTPGYYYAFSLNSKATKARAEIIKSDHTTEKLEFTKMKNRHILDLGYRQSGDIIRLTETGGKSLELTAYRLNEDEFIRLIKNLNSQPFQIKEFTSTKITGTVDVKESGYMVFSLPYEPGWKISVNSKSQEPQIMEGLFLSIPMVEGVHDITLTYSPQGLNTGILISIISLIAVISLHFYKYHKNKRTKHDL